MGGVAAVCPEHGAFRSSILDAANVTNVSLSGNVESCPQCGRASRVVDGVFAFDAEGRLSVTSAPAWSRQALLEALLATDWTPAKVTKTRNAIKRAKKKAQGGDVVSALHEVAVSNRQLGEAISSLSKSQSGWSKSDVMALLSLLLAALTLLQGAIADRDRITEEDVRHIVEDVVSDSVPSDVPPRSDQP